MKKVCKVLQAVPEKVTDDNMNEIGTFVKDILESEIPSLLKQYIRLMASTSIKEKGNEAHECLVTTLDFMKSKNWGSLSDGLAVVVAKELYKPKIETVDDVLIPPKFAEKRKIDAKEFVHEFPPESFITPAKRANVVQLITEKKDAPDSTPLFSEVKAIGARQDFNSPFEGMSKPAKK